MAGDLTLGAPTSTCRGLQSITVTGLNKDSQRKEGLTLGPRICPCDLKPQFCIVPQLGGFLFGRVFGLQKESLSINLLHVIYSK